MLRVVLETDGTEIDGDEELMTFSGSTLLALQQGDSWMPEAAATSEPLSPVVADNVSETPSALGTTPALTGELNMIVCDVLLLHILRSQHFAD